MINASLWPGVRLFGMRTQAAIPLLTAVAIKKYRDVNNRIIDLTV